MTSDQIKQVEDAARFLTRVLAGFNESALYKKYRRDEDFTDHDFEQAMDTLSSFGNGMEVLELAKY